MQFVLNACQLSEYATIALEDGNSAFQLLLSRLQNIATGIVIINSSETHLPYEGDGNIRIEQVYYPENGSISDLFANLQRIIKSKYILYIRADAPFMDIACAKRMADIHEKYAAEFTFADGYPSGFAPEIIDSDLLAVLPCLTEENEAFSISTTLFSIIERDINAFDIETELAPEDMRALRIQLSCDTRNNYLICKALAHKIKTEPDHTIPAVIAAHPQILRQVPMFVAFELITRHPQTVLHSPQKLLTTLRNVTTEELNPDLFHRVLEQVATLSPEATIYFSLWGEIALHSQLEEILQASTSFPVRVICETSGIGWSEQHQALLRADQNRHITWIVNLDSHDPNVYQRIRGDGFEEATRFATDMLRDFPARTYIQAVRMQENEESLEKFYRHWQEHTDNIIIQKYDHYSKKLPERKVVDISPITRFPCWHNKRDLVIHVDGVVPLCREDIGREHTLGNVRTESMADIWNRGQKYYEMHIAHNYPEICHSCDEYYTYNN